MTVDQLITKLEQFRASHCGGDAMEVIISGGSTGSFGKIPTSELSLIEDFIAGGMPPAACCLLKFNVEM